jgi:hypothetical protein
MNLDSPLLPLVIVVCLTVLLLAHRRPGGIRAFLRSRWLSLGVEIDPSPPARKPRPPAPGPDP